MDSVRLDVQGRFKAPDLKTLVALKRLPFSTRRYAKGEDSLTQRYRREEKILVLTVTPDLIAWGILNSEFCLLTPSHIATPKHHQHY